MSFGKEQSVSLLGVDRELPSVLLIDDDMISREVIATLLTMTGYTLHTAEDGARALEMLGSGQCTPQVILVDARMQGLSGARLIKALRARSKAAIYAISGSEPSRSLKAAADGFLLKPFGPDALRKLMEERTAEPTETGLASEEPVVSAETLAQMRQMMPEVSVRNVYSAVLADLQTHVPRLEAALARRDAVEVRRIGHTIKGGCGMAGARQAARLGALLEAESDELNNSGAILRDLKAATGNLERMLKIEFSA